MKALLMNEYVIATLVVLVAYGVSAMIYGTVKGVAQPYSPVVLTAGRFRRGSLANLQVLFFTLIVVWLVFLELARGHGLVDFKTDILLLLGVTALGTGTARVTASAKKNLTIQNWAWLKTKGWIRQDVEREPADRRPRWSDLLVSDGTFEISKFQALVFSLLVGIALVHAGIQGFDATFTIPDFYLGVMGLSQFVYVGGKAVAPNPVVQLNEQLTKLRTLDLQFTDAVALAWKQAGPAATDANGLLTEARLAAPAVYNAYIAAARIAAESVSERTGNTIDESNLQPTIPPAPSAG